MFEIGLTLLAGIAALPILAIAAFVVKIGSPGPLLFRQVRSGRNGVAFRPYKLRTMAATHVHDTEELVPLSHPAIVPAGRLLRRFKIDELPQLLNVLRGEMALIGPRPTLPEQTQRYDEFASRRLLVRRG